MKTLSTLILLGAFAVTPLAAAEAHLDSVVLSDGTRLMGTVTEDTDAHIVIDDHGVVRTLSRSRVLKVNYNDADAPLHEVDDSSAGSGTADNASAGAPDLQAGDDPALTDYCNGIADHYQVPVYQVVSVQQQVPVDEVPVVFELAARAHQAPSMVLGLRLGGLSWGAVSLRLGLGNDAFYVDGGSVVIGTPYAHLYTGFWGLPRARWAGLRLSDADIINCVNFRFVSGYYHRPLAEVVKVRQVQPVYRHVWRPVVVHRTVVKHVAPVRNKVVVKRTVPVHRTVTVEHRVAEHRTVASEHAVSEHRSKPRQHEAPRQDKAHERSDDHGRGDHGDGSHGH